MDLTSLKVVVMEGYDPDIPWYSDWVFWVAITTFFGQELVYTITTFVPLEIYSSTLSCCTPSDRDEDAELGRLHDGMDDGMTTTETWLFTKTGCWIMNIINQLGFALLVLFFAVRDTNLMVRVYLTWLLISNIRNFAIHFRQEYQELSEWQTCNCEADNVYNNLSVSWVEAAIKFFAQTMLVCYYTSGVLEQFGEGEGSWVLYGSTLPVQLLIWQQMGGNFFNGLGKYVLFFKAKQWRIVAEDPDAGWARFRAISRAEVVLRALMDFIVNNIYIDILLLLFPLSLMKQHGAEFVMNAFGVAFITTLDDLPNPCKLQLRKPAPPAAE